EREQIRAVPPSLHKVARAADAEMPEPVTGDGGTAGSRREWTAGFDPAPRIDEHERQLPPVLEAQREPLAVIERAAPHGARGRDVAGDGSSVRLRAATPDREMVRRGFEHLA